MHLFKSISNSIVRRQRRPPRVSAQHVSKIGELHKLDSIPNQDACFDMLRPHDASAKQVNVGSQWQATIASATFAVAVFDGHGDEGHIASQRASTLMQESLDQLLTNNERADLTMVAKKAFAQVAHTLAKEPCARDSGTTATVVLVRDKDMVIAHVGDSCAVLVSQISRTKKCVAKHVTQMHRTNVESEALRVEQAGGILTDGYVVDQVTQNKVMYTMPSCPTASAICL